MRKHIGAILFFIATVLCIGGYKEASAAETEIDSKNFPNIYFRYYIKNTVDTDGNGKLSDVEKSAVKEIDISEASDYQSEYEYPKAESIKGIEYFLNLEKLVCADSLLSDLNISKNRNLKELNCSSNNLDKLDVSKNKKLRVLNCSDNELKSLVVSKNRKLTQLFCDNNHLKKLNVSKNKGLIKLSVSDNKLQKLKLTKLKKLEELYCERNRLKKLNVLKNKKLMTLNCCQNKIKKLVLKKNTLLDYLACSGNRLRSLDLSKNRLLQYLYCERNQMVTGNCRIGSSQLEDCKISPQKRKLRVKKKGKRYFLPLPGLERTNTISKLSKGKATEQGIWLKRKRLPSKISYQYNMFTDGGQKTKVVIHIKKRGRKKNR